MFEVLTSLTTEQMAHVAALATLIGVCVGFVTVGLYRQRRAQDRRLSRAVNNMPYGLVMFDAQERMVTCNDRYIEMYNLSRDVVRPGCTLRDIIRNRIASGSLDNDAEKYRQKLVSAMGRGETSSWEVKTREDRIIAVVNRPIGGGDWIGTHEDITGRRQSEQELVRTKTFLRTVIDNVPVTIVVKHAKDLRYALVNRAGELRHFINREHLIGKTAYELFEPETARAVNGRDRALLDSGADEAVHEGMLETGHKKCLLSTKRLVIRGEEGNPEYLLTVVEDITERKQAEEEVRRARAFLDTVVENVPATIVVKNASDLRYVLINRAGEKYYGISREQMIGKTAAEVFPKSTADIIAQHDRTLLASGREEYFDVHTIETPGNGKRLVSTRRVPINDGSGKPQYLMGVVEDVTERKRAEARIAFLAHHDPLTNLPNRTAFNECMTATLEQAAAAGEQFAALCVDLDRFKEINDVFGHAVGDELLRTVARRLEGAAGGAFLARQGGDEFVLIASGPQPGTAEELADRLVQAVADEIDVAGQALRIGLSVGVAIFPSDGMDAIALIANADAALYRAKEDGRATIRFFEPAMDQRLRERRALQHDLRTAIERDELVLHFQPLARIDGEVTGFEALVRWQHPARGLVPPGIFIPIAEESGFIIALGEWILRAACREAAAWPNPLHIAINLSPIQFRHGDLAALVHAVLLETGLAPDRLSLEITEGVLIGDFSRALSVLRRLKSLGVQIAMDDFGTGYSSLSYLQAFPFDKIKIDQAFIANVDRNPQSAAIIRAVIGLGRGLDLPVVAEGVETEAQRSFLSDESCDEIQGYLIGRPQPIVAYAALVGRDVEPVPELLAAAV
jgi:diguanylate cyclase (GGDEF)-like protein/PAS domain S-box-containing protein